jgi:hypothetical protein
LYQLGLLRDRSFTRLFGLIERRFPGMSGDMIEAIAGALSNHLACRRAGRLAGFALSRCHGLRPYNLRALFAKWSGMID